MRLENKFDFALYFTSNVSNLFLGCDLFFFRLLVYKTFLVMTMFLLHVDLKNSVMPKMTLSWITVVRQFIDHFCNPETKAWDLVSWCLLSGLVCCRKMALAVLFESMKVENKMKVFT